MDNRELFTNKSKDYARFRPSYPAAAIDWLGKRMPTTGCRVLDVGAGTGIFTKALLSVFTDVTALEPNSDMRNMFDRFLPDIPCLDGTGEATGLPDSSVDLITVAQAFHWLDESAFRREAVRILRPGGRVAIVWNTDLKNDFTNARNEVCRKYCPRFRSGHAGKRSAAEGDAFLREEFFSRVEVVRFPNPFPMDRENFAGNMRSRSYALSPDHPDYNMFMVELDAVFERFSQNGIVTEPQETQIYLGIFQ